MSSNNIKFFSPLKNIVASSGPKPMGDAESYALGFAEGRKAYEEMKEGLMKKVSQGYDQAIEEISHRIPDLVLMAVDRLYAGMKIEVETVKAIVKDVLSQWVPENEDLEVYLASEDYEALTKDQDMKQYSRVSFKSDPSLRRGDCLVKSKFGLVDAKIETKLKQLKEDLTQL